MSHKQIRIRLKEKGKEPTYTTIDVEYGDAVAKYKIEELGNQIQSIFYKGYVTVSFLVHNNISNRWIETFAYYADEKRHVTFNNE